VAGGQIYLWVGARRRDYIASQAGCVDHTIHSTAAAVCVHTRWVRSDHGQAERVCVCR